MPTYPATILCALFTPIVRADRPVEFTVDRSTPGSSTTDRSNKTNIKKIAFENKEHTAD